MNITNSLTDKFDECENRSEKEIRLEPDSSINGALAFRLGGSKTRGFFIQHVNQKSKQSKFLYKGDQILKVNGVDVRRLTCDQIVNILRVAVCSNGYALIQVSRKLRYKDDVLGDDVINNKDENGNLCYCYPIHDDLAINDSNAIEPVSLSDTIIGFNQSMIYARAITSSVHYCDDLSETECTQLVCNNDENEKHYSLCKQQRKFSMFGYVRQFADDENDYEYDEKCVECPKCSTKWRWHIVKHRLATNAMKLFPKSASDFFGLHIYQKAYYNLI
ncbi:unnamed protein product [Cercopithifilaria johnstoni]|uniref:PDZ domain-containing protein n=1 Tax=Cercopithifilaria johnstoni TaxID=2874296 RepID=A0A8J2PYD7_9BILA|nr:unnamed protein product [Cercopithifilaria johnstoni]